MLSCSNATLQWYWGLGLITTASVKVTLPWEIWDRRIHFKSGSSILSYENFLLLLQSKEKYKEKQIQDLFFSGLEVLWKFPSSMFQPVTLWERSGLWCRERSMTLSHQQSGFTPAFLLLLLLDGTRVLSAETPSSGIPLQNALVNQSSSVLPQVLWDLVGRRCFQGQPVLSLLMNSAPAAMGWAQSVAQGDSQGRITVSLCDCSSLHVHEGEMEDKKETEAESGEDTS